MDNSLYTTLVFFFRYELDLLWYLCLQVNIDFEKEPIGTGKDGKSIYFRDIWPSNEEIAEVYGLRFLTGVTLVA